MTGLEIRTVPVTGLEIRTVPVTGLDCLFALWANSKVATSF